MKLLSRVVKKLIARAEANTEHIMLVTTKKTERLSYPWGPGEVRVVRQAVYRPLTQRVITGQPFQKQHLRGKQSMAAISADPSAAFPDGYQDGKNRTAKQIDSFLLGRTNAWSVNVTHEPTWASFTSAIQGYLYKRL